jgi:transcriptional regulator with XRE-family HTH domain
MDVRERLRTKVRVLRIERQWSQEELADRAGLHRTYLSSLERGLRNPTITVAARIADALGVSIGELLD